MILGAAWQTTQRLLRGPALVGAGAPLAQEPLERVESVGERDHHCRCGLCLAAAVGSCIALGRIEHLLAHQHAPILHSTAAERNCLQAAAAAPAAVAACMWLPSAFGRLKLTGAMATIEGTDALPAAFRSTRALPPSPSALIAEFEVPRSTPTIDAIGEIQYALRAGLEQRAPTTGSHRPALCPACGAEKVHIALNSEFTMHQARSVKHAC